MTPSLKPKKDALPPWARTGLNWIGRLGHPLVLSTLGASALVLGLRTLGALEGLELGAYDQVLRQRPALPPDDRILVIGINETDIQTRSEWPIQDSTIAELLDRLLAAEPRAIGLDIFRDVPQPTAAEQAVLLEKIRSHNNIFPVCKISSTDSPGVPPPDGTPDSQVSFSDLVVDQGGILRRNLLVAIPPSTATSTASHLCNDANAQLFSLSFQVALQYLAAENVKLSQEAGDLVLGDTTLPRLTPNLGGYRNVDIGGYQLMLNYRSARESFPQRSLTDVLSGGVTPDQIRDRIVFIGATTPEAKDDFYTPFSGGLRDNQKMPGVIVHAQSTSQILSAVLDRRPLLWSWSTLGESLWIIAWGLGGAWFAWKIRRPIIYAAGAAVLMGGLYGACYLLMIQGGWIPLIPPALSWFLASGGVVLLDRFNKSDYGQAVYKQMKSLLRLEIEIDKEKVGQQVSEITDTDYFNKLQTQARELRQKRLDTGSVVKPRPVTPPAGADKPPESGHPASDKSTESMDDLVNSLKLKAQNLKTDDHDEADTDNTP